MIENGPMRWLVVLFLMVGCGLNETAPKKSAPQSLIITPASYYSTPKARYLGGKYKENLDRLVDRITRNSRTSNLQFANNIAAVGGIGFFTHSAAKSPDERYLEVVVGVPETFEIKGSYSAKVSRLFSIYGTELLSILASDAEIAQEKELNGYALNFSWRNIVPQSAGARVSLERAVAYISKNKVKEFLSREMDQNKLLDGAVIFAVEEDGPMNLVSFRPQEINQDARAPIREESLTKIDGSSASQASLSQPLGQQVNQASKESEKRHEDSRSEAIAVKEKAAKQPSEASIPPIGEASPHVTSAGPVEKSTTLEKSAGLSGGERAKEKLSTKTMPQSVAEENGANLPEAKKTDEGAERKVQAKDGTAADAPEAAAASAQVKGIDPFAGEQLASAKSTAVKKAVALVKPRTLEGYIIQLAFDDKGTAQHWAETLERRGHTVSLTETAGSLRVRIGNFALRDDAEGQLRKLRQEGLNGMIINLPQAYRLERRPAAAQGNAAEGSAIQ